ncbi:MAG: sugar nucleotide-binding protein [Eubacteriales bacterium]
MKNILVTGKSGAVSQAFRDYIHENFSKEYNVDLVSLRGDGIYNTDLSKYNAVYHCAGITQADEDNPDSFHEINCNLSEKLANMCEEAGVSKFIFLSTMAVYNTEDRDCKSKGIINSDTSPSPVSPYGSSKLEAEHRICNTAQKMQVFIIRAPSIFGRGTETYLQGYEKLSRLPILPVMFQGCKRSSIYADNLSELVRLIIDSDCPATVKVYLPQNNPPMSVCEYVEILQRVRKRFCVRIPIPCFLQLHCHLFDILFGNISYELPTEDYFEGKYHIVDSMQAIQKTING